MNIQIVNIQTMNIQTMNIQTMNMYVDGEAEPAAKKPKKARKKSLLAQKEYRMMLRRFKHNFYWVKACVRTHKPDTIERMWNCLSEETMFTELARDIHRLDPDDPAVKAFCSEESNVGVRALSRLLYHFFLMQNYDDQLRFNMEAGELHFQAQLFGSAAKSLMEQYCNLNW